MIQLPYLEFLYLVHGLWKKGWGGDCYLDY